VSIDGEVVLDPARAVPEPGAGPVPRVHVDGRLLAGAEARVVYMLHKPVGVLSTASDTHGRPTVLDLVDAHARLYPVGRLDADSSGLILLTNDGDLAHRLTHPRFGVSKTYRARVARPPVTAAQLAKLRAGVALDDGPSAPADVRKLAPDLIELTIREGRNRQVRRMCEAVGHRVLRLERVSIGSLHLGGLSAGAYRRLHAGEIRRLLGGDS
jgi:23S rRNA pseudouridine2605 synthase